MSPNKFKDFNKVSKLYNFNQIPFFKICYLRFNQDSLPEILFKTDFGYNDPKSVSIVSHSIGFEKNLFINPPEAGEGFNKKVTRKNCRC